MSMTTSAGVMGPSHWSYMASVLAEVLEKIALKKKIDEGDVPAGVYIDVKEFFGLIAQALHKKLPDNPPASMNAYAIAAGIVKMSVQPAPDTSEELEKCLARYYSFVRRMRTPTVLTLRDVETAKDLQRFFFRLQREGESEAYERRVDFDDSPHEPHFSVGVTPWRHC